jgi:PucR family transcriptional regulator, proline-responsive transcriptional activator
MEMKLSNFLNKIKTYNPELYISQKEGILIKAVKLLDKDQALFESNYLYVGKTSNLPKVLPQDSYINILCVSNSNLPSKYKKNPLLNLIVLNNNIDMVTIFNEVQEMLTKQQQLAINSAKLLDCLVSEKGIEHIVNTGSELLENPICIIDLSFKLLAASKNIEVEDPIWIELLTKGYCSFDFVSMSNAEKFIELVHKSNSPVFMSKDKFRIPRIISNIKVSNKVVGYLVALECEKPFNEDDLELIFLLCKVLSSEMQKNKFLQNTKGLRYENFIIDLICGEKMDIKTIEERLNFLDLHFKNNLYVLTIKVPQNNFANISLYRIRDTIEYILVDSKSIVYNDTIIVLISRNNKISTLENSFVKLTEFFKKNKIHGGLSRCFHSLIDIQEYYHQALKSIELGIGLKTNKFLFSYEDFAVYHLLQICSEQNNLENFCHASIYDLMEYDQKNNTDYMKCLYTYLINEKSQLETADILSICRSTLAHRIEKIQQIMNIDLNDAITTFRLILTFTILEYVDGTKLIDKLSNKRKLHIYGGASNE